MARSGFNACQRKNVGPQVNIIPVIGKADSCTPSEVQKFKAKVRDVDDGTESNVDPRSWCS